MRHKSAERMNAILAFVNQYQKDFFHSPSVREIANGLSVGRSTVHRYLQEMSVNGMISYDGRQIVTRLTRGLQKPGDFISAAILGSVSCGLPTLEEQFVEGYVDLPASIFGTAKGKYFLLRANGDSMIEAGIDDGDLVIVRQETEVRDGEIVVALVENETTLKRLFRDPENGKVILHPENRTMADIVVDNAGIQGVAVKVIKNLE